MWPFKKSGDKSEATLVSEILNEFGSTSASLIEFSADRYVQSIELSSVTEEDVEAIVNSAREAKLEYGRLQKIELALFSGILLIFLNIGKEVTLMGVSLPASENVLAILIFLFSTAQVILFNVEINASLENKIAEKILIACPRMDQSGVRRLLLKGKLNPFTAWSQALKQKDAVPGWKYGGMMLLLIPIALHLGLAVIAIPLVLFLAAFSLAESSNWQWPFVIILTSAVLGIFARYILSPVFHRARINYIAFKVHSKFFSDLERYGLNGALIILKDEINLLKDDAKLRNASLSAKREKLRRENYRS